MGQKGYGRSIDDWKKEGRLPADFDPENVHDKLNSRAELWRLSREKRNEHGEWEVPAKYPDMAEVVKRIVSVLLLTMLYVYVPNKLN